MPNIGRLYPSEVFVLGYGEAMLKSNLVDNYISTDNIIKFTEVLRKIVGKHSRSKSQIFPVSESKFLKMFDKYIRKHSFKNLKLHSSFYSIVTGDYATGKLRVLEGGLTELKSRLQELCNHLNEINKLFKNNQFRKIGSLIADFPLWVENSKQAKDNENMTLTALKEEGAIYNHTEKIFCKEFRDIINNIIKMQDVFCNNITKIHHEITALSPGSKIKGFADLIDIGKIYKLFSLQVALGGTSVCDLEDRILHIYDNQPFLSGRHELFNLVYRYLSGINEQAVDVMFKSESKNKASLVTIKQLCDHQSSIRKYKNRWASPNFVRKALKEAGIQPVVAPPLVKEPRKYDRAKAITALENAVRKRHPDLFMKI